MSGGRAAVVVLGDIGRSPRMQYHALSLANQAGLEVDIIGFQGSEPHKRLNENPKIHFHYIKQPFPSNVHRILYLLSLPFKIIFQIFSLLFILFHQIQTPDFVLLQNPPSIPTIIIIKFFCFVKKKKMIIDWHNFGYSLLSLSFSPNHPLVKLHKWYETKFGPMSDYHICVSNAMKIDLKNNWNIEATVFYDRPPNFFVSSKMFKKHNLFCHFSGLFLNELKSINQNENDNFLKNMYSNLNDSNYFDPNDFSLISEKKKIENNMGIMNEFDEIDDENDDEKEEEKDKGDDKIDDHHHQNMNNDNENNFYYFLKKNRPGIVISSTSWTKDEDFNLLLESAVMYDRRLISIFEKQEKEIKERKNENLKHNFSTYPNLLFFITGKGPMKSFYEDKIKRLRLRHVAIKTVWLDYDDYLTLLSSCDVGISLHTSSSKLDLPMKIIDMFAFELPVFSIAYSCINELVKEGENGLLFSSSSELSNFLIKFFENFPKKNSFASTLNQGTKKFCAIRWEDEWKKIILPILNQIVDCQ